MDAVLCGVGDVVWNSSECAWMKSQYRVFRLNKRMI